jgi:hypothetical protein
MLDILAGKPSATLRRAVLLLLLGLSTRTLLRPSSAGPPRLFRPLDSALSKLNLPAWKLLLLFYAASTVADNFFLLLFLNPPEPERGVYKKSFFRAQKVLEALDSGFWVSIGQGLGRGWVRDVFSDLKDEFRLDRLEVLDPVHTCSLALQAYICVQWTVPFFVIDGTGSNSRFFNSDRNEHLSGPTPPLSLSPLLHLLPPQPLKMRLRLPPFPCTGYRETTPSILGKRAREPDPPRHPMAHDTLHRNRS